MDHKNSSANLKTLKKSIEELRTKLNNTLNKEDLLRSDILELSQKLDKLIMQYYKIR